MLVVDVLFDAKVQVRVGGRQSKSKEDFEGGLQGGLELREDRCVDNKHSQARKIMNQQYFFREAEA